MNEKISFQVKSDFTSIVDFSDEWKITEQIEILLEGFSDVLASYERYFNKNKINLNNTENLMVVMYFLLVKAYKKCLSCHSFNEINILYGKLQIGKDFLGKVEHK